MPRWSSAALWLLAALTVLGLPSGPSMDERDAIQTAVQLGCLAIAWYFVLQRQRVIHHGWAMLPLAVTVLGASDMVNALERNPFHLSSPVKPSSLIALVGYVMLGTAVYRLNRNRSRGRKMPGGIESAIFASGAFPMVLVFLVLPVMHHPAMSTSEKAVTIAFAGA